MEEASLQQITIKTPEFMEMAVNGWFSILEAQFHLRNITASTTKFYTVISSLPAEVVAKIPITILESKKYEEIKQSLIEAHERTKPKLLDKLMSTTTITGRPSTYLQEMLSIAKRIGIGEEIVIHKFLQALPATISPVIASRKELSPTQLGKLADELMLLLNNINATAFTAQHRTQKNEKSKDNIILPTGIKPFFPEQKAKICRAYLYFAEQARTCKPWCRWPKKQNTKILPNSRPPTPTQTDSEN